MIGNWVVTDRRRQKVAGNQLGALVNQLVKCMLSVGARLTPDNRTGLIHDGMAIAVHRFSVALHVSLLKVSREAVEILVVGENCLRGSSEKVVIPDADERQYHGKIFLEWRVFEMLVHRVSSFQQ